MRSSGRLPIAYGRPSRPVSSDPSRTTTNSLVFYIHPCRGPSFKPRRNAARLLSNDSRRPSFRRSYVERALLAIGRGGRHPANSPAGGEDGVTESRGGPQRRRPRGDSARARRAAPAGEDRPRELTISSQPHDGEHVTVAVHGTGVGIDPNHLDRLFDAFFTTKPGGIGMGLRSAAAACGGGDYCSPYLLLRPSGSASNPPKA